MFIYQIVFKLKGKITGPWNIGHSDIFILRSIVVSYGLIIPNYDVQTSNSLQNIRQSHWTVKYRSCWPSFHDPQVHVRRLSHIWPTIWTGRKYERTERKNENYIPLGINAGGIMTRFVTLLWSAWFHSLPKSCCGPATVMCIVFSKDSK